MRTVAYPTQFSGNQSNLLIYLMLLMFLCFYFMSTTMFLHWKTEAASHTSLRRSHSRRDYSRRDQTISYTKHSRRCLSGLDYVGGVARRQRLGLEYVEHPLARVTELLHPTSGWHHRNIRDRTYLDLGNYPIFSHYIYLYITYVRRFVSIPYLCQHNTKCSKFIYCLFLLVYYLGRNREVLYPR